MADIFITSSGRRPGWEDVEPVPQDDGPDPVVSIRYADEFRATMDLFRAVLRAQELSARALSLTAAVVEGNPANYTAWQYRRRCLDAIGADLREELRFTEATAYDNPKNYQIW
jgi:protein farnesyltransferase/geranylgeranyltransferase type-1 subunit alpha